MLNLPNYTFPNGTRPDDILIQTQSAVNVFIPMFLFFLFFVIFLGGTSRQKMRTGTADYPMWAVVSSLSILIISLLLGVVSGLISLGTTVIIVVITISSGAWLFLDRKINEE